MFSPEPALPLHETMLAARRRALDHYEHPLPVCELLLQIHDPAGLDDPCAGCQQAWPCKRVLGILGGLVPLP
jgi:hypothetical protein